MVYNIVSVRKRQEPKMQPLKQDRGAGPDQPGLLAPDTTGMNFYRADPALADLYERRFRPEFLPAFQAWLAQDPLNNPAATPSPLLQPEYHVADLEKSDRLERQGSQHFENGKNATERTDSYVLSTVFFASVLFFAGISMRFVWRKMRITVLVLATLTLAYGVVQIATLPVL